MGFTHVAAAVMGLGLAVAPLAAQLRANRPSTLPQNLPRLLVSNPHSFSTQDSSASVRVGHGLRLRITTVSERWYKTLERAQMNDALQQYAYPVDAVLPPMVARALAASLNARAMVIATMVRDQAGRYTVEARLTGSNDDAGQIVRLSQNANESFEDFGTRLGEAFAPAFRALPEAKDCENLRQSEPAKAAEEAAKAIRYLPNSGLAHYCLAQIAIAKKAPVDTIVSHLRLATQGDPQSLNAWTLLAVQYQAKGDSAATIATFQQLLRIAPTNEVLRKEAFGLFLRYGRTDAAERVADEGLQLDPANADLWDLKSSACLFQDTPEKNRCAVESLERVFALDSAKADTTFFTKITFAASRPIRVDTLKIPADSTRPARDSVTQVVDHGRFKRWAVLAVQKYPDNAILIGQLAEAYSLAGPVDSAVAVTKRLMAVDSSDVTPVLRVAKALADAKRGREVIELVPYLERLGSVDNKQNMAAILVTAAFPLLQPPPDYPLAADMARAALKFATPDTQIFRFGNFILGASVFQQMVALDTEATNAKSCEMTRQLPVLLAEAGPALEAGRAIAESFAAPRIQALPTYTTRFEQMIRAYCR